MPSRSRENGLWGWLLEGAPAGALLLRVENKIEVGTPDVFGVWGESFVVELKSVARTSSGVIDCKLKPEQADTLRRWQRAGGRAWVLVKVGFQATALRYLVPAHRCNMLVRPINELHLDALAVCNANLPALELLKIMSGKYKAHDA